MQDIDIVIEICGSAGEGTISAGEILSRFMSEAGYEIMSFDSYPAEIRGFGKCVAHTRVSTSPIFSPGKYADVLIALNDGHTISQLGTLKPDGILIYDSQPSSWHSEDKSVMAWVQPGMTTYGVPLARLATKAAGNTRGRNMVALGAAAALMTIGQDGFVASIRRRYAKKKQAIIDSNVNSFSEGYAWALENIEKTDPYTFTGTQPETADTTKLIINGNQAVAMAAVDSNLALYAGYPITPATKIMEILGKELPKRGGIMLQTEDEISAIGAVIGAGFGGKRAMTATSGPGFCLMTEFTGLSVMAEVPAVIVDSQRGGPCTGLPTKTEQSDLRMALSGTGDSPRIVLAPSDTASCYQATALGLYLAEKYQTLVIILLDFFLSNSIKNIPAPVKPGPEMLDANIAPAPGDLDGYARYRLTDSGISPRTIPGTPGGMFFSTGLEHDEHGRPRYDSKTHTVMTQKRYRKLASVLSEAPPPQVSGANGQVDLGIISWGSSAGAAHEAVMTAARKGKSVAGFSTIMLSPLPQDALREFAARCTTILVPELNFTGQFADVVESTIHRPVKRLNLVTGLPMASEDILQKMREL
ncbi:MAG: 2-oxoacid:acceptor oxidoreductase subunit alpha [Pseudomonadota bacterium]